jgi:SAM-dependent methyltransferase
MSVVDTFIQHLHQKKAPKVLELGTKQWVDGVATHHRSWLPEDAIHIMSDVDSGADVDVVADAHDLSPFEDNSFDAFIAVSVWEHLRKPWIAADTAARVLKPGGVLIVATHFAFPVHGYPSDYGRWTDVGLEALFDAPLWHSQKSQFLYPSTIIPPKEVTVWNTAAPSYLNVEVFAIKS